MNYFGFDEAIFPEVKDVLSTHGFLKKDITDRFGLKSGIPVSYKARDQLNNEAAAINAGSDNLLKLTFWQRRRTHARKQLINASIHNLDLNKHTSAHLYRSAHEGIAYAFRYGLDIICKTAQRRYSSFDKKKEKILKPVKYG